MIVDGGYKGEEYIYAKGRCREVSLIEVAVNSRHETVNYHLKKLGIVDDFQA